MFLHYYSCLEITLPTDSPGCDIRGCIQNYPDRVDNEIYAYNNKYALRNNTKGYGGKTHQADSQNSDTTACSGRELYHLQFSLQAASPETFGYTIACNFYYKTPCSNLFQCALDWALHCYSHLFHDCACTVARTYPPPPPPTVFESYIMTLFFHLTCCNFWS
jgi:hypothetical protein